MQSSRGKGKNLRTALVLASVALAVFLGFIARNWYLGR